MDTPVYKCVNYFCPARCQGYSPCPKHDHKILCTILHTFEKHELQLYKYTYLSRNFNGQNRTCFD